MSFVRKRKTYKPNPRIIPGCCFRVRWFCPLRNQLEDSLGTDNFSGNQLEQYGADGPRRVIICGWDACGCCACEVAPCQAKELQAKGKHEEAMQAFTAKVACTDACVLIIFALQSRKSDLPCCVCHPFSYLSLKHMAHALTFTTLCLVRACKAPFFPCLPHLTSLHVCDAQQICLNIAADWVCTWKTRKICYWLKRCLERSSSLQWKRRRWTWRVKRRIILID